MAFSSTMVIDGKLRVLSSRRFCTSCSPFGAHNTSPRPLDDPRVRRRQSWVNYSRRRRIWMKGELIGARGGRCEDCGYGRTIWALEFHHRDAKTKDFSLGGFLGSIERARREADKCFLVCANCHRIRHARSKTDSGHPVVRSGQKIKVRAVAAAGGACRGCGFDAPVDALEFHHLDPTAKEFGISVDGVPRSWARVEAELAKCVLLCANCHRETHAGLRSFTTDQAIGEALTRYRIEIQRHAA
jgi:5-methylcytosine-specific restriction endonuclease McrA